jgi:hypothetical protein
MWDESAYIVTHHAVVQGFPPQWMEFRTTVKDIPGATIRLDLADYPEAGGTTELHGDGGGTSPNTSTAWSVDEISRIEMLACMLGRHVPEYTLTYTTPRSKAWSLVSVVTFIGGAVVAFAILVVSLVMRQIRTIPRGFDVIGRTR